MADFFKAFLTRILLLKNYKYKKAIFLKAIIKLRFIGTIRKKVFFETILKYFKLKTGIYVDCLEFNYGSGEFEIFDVDGVENEYERKKMKINIIQLNVYSCLSKSRFNTFSALNFGKKENIGE